MYFLLQKIYTKQAYLDLPAPNNNAKIAFKNLFYLKFMTFRVIQIQC